MSPEQATGAVADKRSDVWSFGVVLFEMLTGQRLFEGQTTSHVLADVIRAEIDFARLPPTTPPDLRTLIERSLERDPRRRLRDIREARLVLERLLERGTGAHSAVRSGTMVAPPSVRSRRNRLPQFGVGGLVVASLAVAAAGWMRPTGNSSPQLRVAVRLANSALFTSVGAAFDLSADGRQIAMVTGNPASPNSGGLVVRRLNELDSTTLVDPGANPDIQVVPYNPFFSPDGEWVGYAVPGELRKVPTSGGTPLTICKVTRSRGASWGADGTIVFSPSPNSGLFRVSAAGGEPQALTTLSTGAKEATHRWPQILPGGKSVLFTSHTSPTGAFDNAVIEVVTIDTGERKVVHTGGAYARYVPSGHLVYAHNNTLLAVPFDLKRLSVTGPAAPVVQNVTANSNEGVAQFAFAATGLMAYMQGASELPIFPIAWVDRSGQSTTLVAEEGTYANPRLSPDGKRLSLTVHKSRNWDIWVYDLERRISTRVTFDEVAETEQVWSPDGRELAYTAEGVQGPQTLYRKPADGSGSATPILTGDHALWAQAWSPDGQVLGLTSAEGDIGLLPIAQKDAKPTWPLNSRFSESDPAFSPDGRWLAYSSRESGQSEIYVKRFPSGSGRWQISSGGGAFARWSGGGRELFYRSPTGIMAAAIEPVGESLRTGTPRELFKGDFLGGLGGMELGAYVFADFDVSPDGTRFVMFPKPVDKVARNSGMVTLVSNWFDDISRATQQK
jgi:serine/threonine-protein kinase